MILSIFHLFDSIWDDAAADAAAITAAVDGVVMEFCSIYYW